MTVFSRVTKLSFLLLVFIWQAGFGSSYQDQFLSISGSDSLLAAAVEVVGLEPNADATGLDLTDGRTSGYLVLAIQETEQYFNRGLPSWNGYAGDGTSAFKVFMRFPEGSGWSDWLTVGYWKDHLWSSYGTTSFSGGYIDIDYVKLYSYQTRWQFRIEFYRTGSDVKSPSVNKISFLASDDNTTDEVNYTDIVNDKPPATLVPTTFYYQYGLDDNIGGSICSPTTVSMIIASYDLPVDPVDLAWDIYDPVKGIFGVWPRAIQGGVSAGLEGAVTRYRSWSEAYSVLDQGGRIGMSVGNPLYSGHLMMLAGFDSNGNPLVHDPARSNGYAYRFDKLQLSQSWFDKGGIAYTFYLPDSTTVASADKHFPLIAGNSGFEIGNNYPNPFNATTVLPVKVDVIQRININIYDNRGRRVNSIFSGIIIPGDHNFSWSGSDDNGNPVASGIYWAVVDNEYGNRQTLPITLLK